MSILVPHHHHHQINCDPWPSKWNHFFRWILYHYEIGWSVQIPRHRRRDLSGPSDELLLSTQLWKKYKNKNKTLMTLIRYENDAFYTTGETKTKKTTPRSRETPLDLSAIVPCRVGVFGIRLEFLHAVLHECVCGMREKSLLTLEGDTIRLVSFCHPHQRPPPSQGSQFHLGGLRLCIIFYERLY